MSASRAASRAVSPDAPDAAPATTPASPRPRTFRRVAGLLLVLAVVGALAGFIAERRARALPILRLLDDMASRIPAEREGARTRLIAQPAEAAPVLVQIVRRGKSRWHSDILPWFDSVPAIARTRALQASRERNAIDALQRMGAPAAASLLPLLGETRYGGRETAIAVLHSYGFDARPVLLDALVSAPPKVRAGAALTLGRFPLRTTADLEPLIRILADREAAVRLAAVWALGQCSAYPAEAAPPIIAALDDRAPSVRSEALRMLRNFGTNAAPALGRLRRILAEATPDLRLEAVLTLAQTGPSARTAEPELRAALRHPEPRLARQAAVTLLQLDLAPNDALAVLRGFLRHPEPGFRARTADLLGPLGSRAAELVPDLVALLDNTEPRDDRAALAALRAIQPSALPPGAAERERPPSRRRDRPPAP